MRIFSRWSKTSRKMHVWYILLMNCLLGSLHFLNFFLRAKNGKEIRTFFLTGHLLGLGQEAPRVTSWFRKNGGQWNSDLLQPTQGQGRNVGYVELWMGDATSAGQVCWSPADSRLWDFFLRAFFFVVAAKIQDCFKIRVPWLSLELDKLKPWTQ